MLAGLAGQTHDPTDEVSANARATLEHMRELATGQAVTSLIGRPAAKAAAVPQRRKRRNIYDAQHRLLLPGKLAMSKHTPRHSDIEVIEAFEGSGATYDFFLQVFGRDSIDGNGMRLDSTVHYGTRFENALWNGRQMVYGDGDGRIFKRFTASVDVIAHELTHAVTQHAAALGYAGQTGALNEHLSDAFGIMVKQYKLDQTADASDWLIGTDLFGPGVNGCAIRSLAFPGTAYDDPVLGRDPQPSHMRDYVVTTDDNGGVHINSGILNHGFYIAAMSLGGKTWEVLGRIWYAVLTGGLKPEADFADFTRATVDIAAQLYGKGSRVVKILVEAWSDVGLPVLPAVPTAVNDGAKVRLSIRRAKHAARRSSNNLQPISERRTIP
jgi:Zn-dependent metalloprotease